MEFWLGLATGIITTLALCGGLFALYLINGAPRF